MIGIESDKIELYPYCDKYRDIAKETIKKLQNIFGDLLVKIEHIGSTSIVGIKSKPIIDIVIGVKSFDVINLIKENLEQEGFLFENLKVHNTIVSYKCENNGKRTHNIHIVIFGEERWQEFVVFRNYLNLHPDVAKEYEKLKTTLSKQYKTIREYTSNKNKFVLDVLEKAKQ